MKLNQLSLFLENKPGRLSLPCKVLAQEGINITTMSLADTQQFGILRLVVKDWQKAKGVLEKAGVIVKVTEVLAVEVPDKPGALARVLEIIEQAGINIEYMYAFTFGRKDHAVLIFRFDDPDTAIKVIQSHGMNVIAGGDLFQGRE